MVYLCYVEEATTFQEIYQWTDKWAANHDVTLVIIGNGPYNKKFPPVRFVSYDDARQSDLLKDLQWIYLDFDGGDFHSFDHPTDNVVYALGSDWNGFEGHTKDGISLTVDGGQQYAAVLTPVIFHERFLYFTGRRV